MITYLYGAWWVKKSSDFSDPPGPALTVAKRYCVWDGIPYGQQNTMRKTNDQLLGRVWWVNKSRREFSDPPGPGFSGAVRFCVLDGPMHYL